MWSHMTTRVGRDFPGTAPTNTNNNYYSAIAELPPETVYILFPLPWQSYYWTTIMQPNDKIMVMARLPDRLIIIIIIMRALQQ